VFAIDIELLKTCEILLAHREAMPTSRSSYNF